MKRWATSITAAFVTWLFILWGLYLYLPVTLAVWLAILVPLAVGIIVFRRRA